jgi:serine/threonine protein kinase
MAPIKISHYRILNKLGAGGMGEVYLAEDTKLDRKVAIKLLPSELTTDEQAKRRLIREARASAKLDHPNICSIHEVAEEDGRGYIVMQYVEGETLDVRSQRKTIDLKEALDFAVQSADALTEAHSHGIIHRDIKPQNIIITPRGQVKMMDFGLAKVVQREFSTDTEAQTESLLTEPGMVIGTVPYMSPEQVRGEPIDVRSDIFSFGIVLYEMITGHQPFRAPSLGATMSAILTSEPPMLSRYVREIPEAFEWVVSKALRKNTDERYQTAKELHTDLVSLKQRLELNAAFERQNESNFPAADEKSTVATAKSAVRRTGDVLQSQPLRFGHRR